MKSVLTKSTTAGIALLGLVACGNVQQEIVESRETTATSRNSRRQSSRPSSTDGPSSNTCKTACPTARFMT